VRARVIASADAGLEAAVEAGAFRSDLYHRLRVLPLFIPPLRERREDILPLARAFAVEIAARMRRGAPSLIADSEDALLRYSWPGNARELRYCLERALVAGTGDRLTAADLPAEVLEGGDAYLMPDGPARPTLQDVERRYIALTLQRVHGNQTEAAKILGISRKALWEKRKRYGME
jgi:DNA-binding NtrC family response regulator